MIVKTGNIVNNFTYLNLSKCTLSAESLEILSPNLKNLVELDISYCVGITQWLFLLDFTSTIRTLNVSHLNNVANGKQLCSMLSGLNQLQILDVSYTKLNITDLTFYISKLSSLTNLNLQQENDPQYCVTDDIISQLLSVTTLRALYLSGYELTANGIYALNNFPHLVELGFDHLVGFSKLSPLGGFTKLTSLAIESSELDDASVEGVLSVLSGITRLNLADNFITGDGVLALSSMIHLRSLNVSKNEIGMNRNLDHHCFANLTCLTELNLSNNPIVSSRPWLNRKFVINHLEFLLKLTTLTSLSFDNPTKENGIQDSGLDYFRNLSNLTYLSLKRHSLADNFIPKLKKLPQLRQLDISENNITNLGLLQITHMVNLESIDIQNTTLSDTALLYLVNLPHLTSISLAGSRVSDKAVSVLEKHYPSISVINK